MAFCKERESCNPLVCRAPCPVGEELRKISKLPACKNACWWLKEGINKNRSCKNTNCKIQDTILEFMKENHT